ncbi:MAG: hypothetical protein HRT53_01610 [Colwellia sp.]|nr:hypothetical protein [Colwellia sp.]
MIIAKITKITKIAKITPFFIILSITSALAHSSPTKMNNETLDEAPNPQIGICKDYPVCKIIPLNFCNSDPICNEFFEKKKRSKKEEEEEVKKNATT